MKRTRSGKSGAGKATEKYKKEQASTYAKAETCFFMSFFLISYLSQGCGQGIGSLLLHGGFFLILAGLVDVASLLLEDT